jgi:hopene-associated glycosyltransferase HpnB
MTATLVFLSLLTLLWLFLFVSPAHRVFFRDRLDITTPLADPPAWPSVTVVVPARNEAAMLPTTLPSLCTQNYPGLRVVLVDDQSDDGTPALLEEFKARYANLATLRAADRPAGWCGKPWAVSQGVAAAGAPELLLFTDADIVFHPTAVRQAVRLLHAGPYDLVSLFPQLIFGSAFERIALTGLVTVLALAYPAGVVNNPKSKQALAAGGFILVRRAPYEAIGGHGAVAGEVIEDLNLARHLKAAGARLHIRLTDDLITTRMYDTVGDTWEGLAKNAFAGAQYKGVNFAWGMLVCLAVAVLPPVYLVVSLILTLMRWPPSPQVRALVLLCAAINLLMTLIHRRTIRHFRLPAYHALFMPLSLGLYLVIAASSLYQHYFKGGAAWKGRRYGASAAASRSDVTNPQPGA